MPARPTPRSTGANIPPAKSEPGGQLAADEVLDDGHAERAVVEARDIGELLAAGRQEAGAVLHVQFLQRLEAIGGEARRDDGEAPGASLGKALHGVDGVGLEPRVAAELRLEGRVPAPGRPGQLLAHQPRRLLALAVIR